MGARDRPHVVMGQKAKKPSKGAVKKEKEVEVPEVEEEAYVYPIWATAILWIARISAIMWILREAYTIRLYAINNYGRVIHEFDPWFNFRATQYLADNGYEKFFHWFDYMSWYPLGRPVGTTIYPGMQMTSVTIWKVMNATGFPMSLNDVCCFVPAWFGVVATTFLGLLTHECSGSINSGIFAAGIMAIIPAHIMRSVGGGYDNESIAVSAMCITFYFWCRSLRHYDASKGSWMIGAVAGVAHIYMAAVWGGYVFVINLIGLHAGMLALQFAFRKDFNETLHRSYSLFYIIGTIGATGWLDSSQISRADDANARLRRHASPRLRRDSAQEGQPQLLSGSCTACEVRPRRGCCRSCHRRYSVPYRLLRTSVISCSWPVCQAHTHRQPSGRLCR